jgi:ribosomal protein S27E
VGFIVQCTHCSQLVIHPDQRFNFFSDYSQTVSCPHCGVQDFHFTKPLTTYVSRDELTKVPYVYRSRIHERTITLRFLGIILRVLILEVSVWIS